MNVPKINEKRRAFLGFSLGFNASAALVDDKGNIIAAISQERLNGEKNTKQMPIDAMIECCKVAKISEIFSVSYSHYQGLTYKEVCKIIPEKYKSYVQNMVFMKDCENSKDVEICLFVILEDILKDNGIRVLNEGLTRMEHHASHLSAALAIYGEVGSYYGITMDGFGDGISCRLVEVEAGKEIARKEYPLASSIGLIYQFVTGALGFKMHQHEGKITGLAAYGVPLFPNPFFEIYKDDAFNENAFTLEVDCEKLKKLSEDQMKMVEDSTIIDFDLFLRLKDTIFALVEMLQTEGISQSDIAASVQGYAERAVLSCIKAFLKNEAKGKIKKKVCYLSGGLFANVKINQKVREAFSCELYEEGFFKEVLIAPPMGDEGTAIGAAFLGMKTKKAEEYRVGLKSDEVVDMNVFAGTKMKNFCFEKFMNNKNKIVDEIAERLAQKQIVCLCTGKMEFGPRALCHRSILYDCTDKSTNDWLNKQLGRTEFMPFAPVCLEEDAFDLFVNYGSDCSTTTKYMTMTLDCAEEMKKNYPAAVHIDGTARPQVIGYSEETELIREILQEYKRRTGKKVLINTSFNLHNYPIIESKQIAVSSWMKSNTDVLVIEGTFLTKEDVGNV